MNTDREKIMAFARNKEERHFIARCLDHIQIVLGKNRIVLTDFLDPGQLELLKDISRAYRLIKVKYWGGYTGAERCRALLADKNNNWPEENYQIGLLQVAPVGWNGAPGHRDYLGTLVGLGVRREKLGDIVLQDGGAVIFAADEIVSFLSQNLCKVGRYPVTVKPIDPGDFVFQPPEVKEKVITAASARLDAVVSKAFNLSRSVSGELICQGKVFLNWRQQVNPAAAVACGDTISCRGYGRFKLLEYMGTTKKGRERFKLGFGSNR